MGNVLNHHEMGVLLARDVTTRYAQTAIAFSPSAPWVAPAFSRHHTIIK